MRKVFLFTVLSVFVWLLLIAPSFASMTFGTNTVTLETGITSAIHEINIVYDNEDRAHVFYRVGSTIHRYYKGKNDSAWTKQASIASGNTYKVLYKNNKFYIISIIGNNGYLYQSSSNTGSFSGANLGDLKHLSYHSVYAWANTWDADVDSNDKVYFLYNSSFSEDDYNENYFMYATNLSGSLVKTNIGGSYTSSGNAYHRVRVISPSNIQIWYAYAPYPYAAYTRTFNGTSWSSPVTISAPNFISNLVFDRYKRVNSFFATSSHTTSSDQKTYRFNGTSLNLSSAYLAQAAVADDQGAMHVIDGYFGDYTFPYYYRTTIGGVQLRNSSNAVTAVNNISLGVSSVGKNYEVLAAYDWRLAWNNYNLVVTVLDFLRSNISVSLPSRTENSLNVSIGRAGNPSGVQIRTQVSTTSNFVNIVSTLDTTATSITHTGLLPNTLYYVRGIVKHGSGITSFISSTSNIFTLANVPSIPTSLDSTEDTLTITWDQNGNPSGTLYILESSLTGNPAGSDWQQRYLGTDLQFTHEGLSPDTIYYYRVKAINGNSVHTAYSGVAGFKTKSILDSLKDDMEEVKQTVTSIQTAATNAQTSAETAALKAEEAKTAIENIHLYLPPTLSRIKGQNNRTVTSGTTFRIVLEYSNAIEYRYKLNDNPWTPWNSLNGYLTNGYLEISGLINGVNTLTVEIRNQNGITASNSTFLFKI